MRTSVTLMGGELAGNAADLRSPLLRRDGLLLTLLDDEGVVGSGEASPLPGYSPDGLDAAHGELAAWTPPALDPQAPPLALIERCGARLRSPSARFAVESAVLDWLGRRTGRPVHRLLGAPPAARAIPLGHLLPTARAAESAAVLHARGVRHLKLKIGGDVERELRVLRAVRAAVPDAEIRLDANGTLPPDRVTALAPAWHDLGVTLVEEPCAIAVLPALPRLAVAVGLDETLVRDDAEALVRAIARTQRLGAVVLKPTTLGGITRCLALAATAREVGAEPIVTHTFDGPVAMAAAAELALALADARMAGLAPHACLSAYPPRRAAALGETAVTTHDAPGLGLEAAP